MNTYNICKTKDEVIEVLSQKRHVLSASGTPAMIARTNEALLRLWSMGEVLIYKDGTVQSLEA